MGWQLKGNIFHNISQHILKCEVLQREYMTGDLVRDKVVYEDIFNHNVAKQKTITVMFKELFKIKENILQKVDPSNTPVMLKLDDNLLSCTVHSSFGK